jgi:signal transduction histidine kinase
VAATGSDASGRRDGRSPLPRRVSLRLRLTLLYGACFMVGSAAVLAVTYLLVAQDTSSQTRQLRVGGTKVQLPRSPLTVMAGGAGAVPASGGKGAMMIEQIHISPSGRETITWAPSRSTKPSAAEKLALYGPRYSAVQMARIRAGALAMSKCMRAHGVNYPNLKVGRGPGGHSFELSVPPRSVGRDPSFKADNTLCSRLLNDSIPGPGPTAKRIASSVQNQLNVIVERANGALTTQRSRSLRVLLTWSGVALGVLALISILLGWLVAGRALRPLRTMSSRARRITEQNLHERLSVDVQEDELGELAGTFDGVLARLEHAFDAQKRFVANASHELRTPVTLERALLEIALANPETDAETLRRTCERVLASTKQQEQMIEALLTLARSQSGTDVDAPADLAELAQDAVTLRQRRADGLTLATDLHPAPLTGDPALLERLVANLVENAIVHNRADDGWISVETGHDTAGSWLRVSNSGPEVPEGKISEIFEPFRRMDGERTATVTGVGLGLSIVRAIADLHGATIDAGPVQGGGLRVRVRF